jgi:hypothetical protein
MIMQIVSEEWYEKRDLPDAKTTVLIDKRKRMVRSV